MTTFSRAAAMVMTVGVLSGSACGRTDPPPAARTDVPEPAVAPTPAAAIEGTVVPLPGAPEGLAFDPVTNLLAVAVRDPGGIVLVDGTTGAEKTRIALPGAARHLTLAAPGGPVLVPTENNDRLYRIALPAGTVVADEAVGRQPHDVALSADGTAFVGDELADSVSLLAGGTRTVVPAPVQPGGVAALIDGSIVAVVGVRGRRIEAFSSDGRSLGAAACGVGPTHIEAGLGNLFYVADTQGDALLTYEADTEGIRQIARTPTGAGGAPYGLVVDAERKKVYVTLTGTNQLRSFAIDAKRLVAGKTWATVRQPNDIAVDPATGRLIVAGTADGQLQLLDPAA